MGNRNHRSPGSGSLSQRPDGAWIARVTDVRTGRRPKRIIPLGVRDDGRPETAAAHRRRAESVLAELSKEVEDGRSTRPESPTVRQFAATWLEIRTELKTTTREHYERMLQLYINPVLGDVALDQLTGADIDRLDRELASRSLGSATRRHARRTLTLVLKEARYESLVDDLATSTARPIKADPPERRRPQRRDAIDGPEMARLLAEAHGSRFEPLLAVLGLLGLRSGEALGLAWDMVDLNQGILRVERNLVAVNGGVQLSTPKTDDRSVRSLPLPPTVAASLRRWKIQQNEERLAAPAWDRSFGVDFVFTDEVGRPLSRGRLSAALKRYAASAGVGRISPHTLRHSAGSIALGAGVPITEVSRMLGHKNPGITLKVYAHSLSDGSRATTAVADAVGSWHVSGVEEVSMS